MENNRLITIASVLVAGTVAVIIAMKWSRVNRVFKKAKRESLAQLKATINNVTPHRKGTIIRKTSHKTEEELVSNKISIDTQHGLDGNNASLKTCDNEGVGEDGDGYDKKILEFLTMNKRGHTLAELGVNLGVPYIALVRPIKKLMIQGSLRKEGKFYVMVNTEMNSIQGT